jgi:hypothetical protein
MLCALSVMIVPPMRVGAQEEDEEEDVEAVVQVQPAITDAQFDQWVFRQHRTAAGARQSLNSLLALQAEHIDRACGLTDAQKKKLQLAGRGDIKRFFDNYEEIKQKFQSLKHDRQKANQIWQDLRPLHSSLQAGLFHVDSFLYKSLRNTLTKDQFTRYAVIASDRRKLRHRAKIELTVAMLEQGMPLRDEQRQKLITLLVNETKPPRRSGQYDYYVIMFYLSRMQDEKLKPLLDNVQWKVLNRQLDQARGMEHWLRQAGHLSDDDEDNDEAQPAAQVQKE